MNAQQFKITDYSQRGEIVAFSEDAIYTAPTGRKALDQHLKLIKCKGKVKVSGNNNVHFKVTPICFENGRMLIDGRKRAMWYQLVNFG